MIPRAVRPFILMRSGVSKRRCREYFRAPGGLLAVQPPPVEKFVPNVRVHGEVPDAKRYEILKKVRSLGRGDPESLKLVSTITRAPESDPSSRVSRAMDRTIPQRPTPMRMYGVLEAVELAR